MSETSRRKVLIATIGDRDPIFNDRAMGPLLAARRLNPAIVYLIHSAVGKIDYPENARATESAIRVERPECEVHLVEHDAVDPSSTEDLFRAFRKCLPSLDGFEIHLCSSSGTPQMGLALTLIAAARYGNDFVCHWQAKAPVAVEGVLAPEIDGKRLQQFNPAGIFQYHDFIEALKSLEACRISEARIRLSRIDGSGAFADRVTAAKTIATVLDRFAGFERIGTERCLDDIGRVRKLRERFPVYADWTTWSREVTTNPELWPIELFAVSLRHRKGSNPLLAVVTLESALEVALHFRITSGHKLDADRLEEKDRVRIRAVFRDAKFTDLSNGAVRLESWRQRLQLLQKLGDVVGGIPANHERTWEDLANARNTILHQGKSNRVTDGLLDRGFRLAEWFCEACKWRSPAAVPSAPTGIERLAREIADAARVAL